MGSLLLALVSLQCCCIGSSKMTTLLSWVYTFFLSLCSLLSRFVFVLSSLTVAFDRFDAPNNGGNGKMLEQSAKTRDAHLYGMLKQEIKASALETWSYTPLCAFRCILLYRDHPDHCSTHRQPLLSIPSIAGIWDSLRMPRKISDPSTHWKRRLWTGL